MVSTSFKPAVARFIEPIARFFHKIGITPDMVTLFGAIGATSSALILLISGEFFWASIAVSLFALSDLFDGAIARISEKGATQWGAFLDSTCDRVTDAAILMGLSLYLIQVEDPLVPLVLGCILFGSLIPYIRAKAESYKIPCSVGVAERTERLIIILVAIGFHGLGVSYILSVGIWLLFGLSVITVIQRIFVIRKGLLSR
jgi:CDP-diacylglycerol---glycerol-3-phosphate 3-phosphatidyltransferase